jgi:hypothetical protein
VNVKENGEKLIPELLGNCFFMQNRRIRPDYEATESGLFSATKLIWGIFIFVSVRTLAVKK